MLRPIRRCARPSESATARGALAGRVFFMIEPGPQRRSAGRVPPAPKLLHRAKPSSSTSPERLEKGLRFVHLDWHPPTELSIEPLWLIGTLSSTGVSCVSDLRRH